MSSVTREILENKLKVLSESFQKFLYIDDSDFMKGMADNNISGDDIRKYQFLVHIKYLTDKKTGLFFHGWTFNGRNNSAEALWGRGNSWVTAAIPELFRMIKDIPAPAAGYLRNSLSCQVKALVKYQEDSGLWHTLIDDKTSYTETSATCGFGYGILAAVYEGLLPAVFKDSAMKAVSGVLDNIDEDGTVEGVSYGTPMGRESKDFYKNIPIRPMPYGQAMAMLLLLEAEE